MRIAIMADVHSNHIALEACVREARKRGAEEFLFLGDYLGELAFPEKNKESSIFLQSTSLTMTLSAAGEVPFMKSGKLISRFFTGWQKNTEVFRMKRILALILVMILAAGSAISAFAEEESAGQQPQEGSSFMDGTVPPEPPDGEIPGGPGGTPPDGMPGGTPPDGVPGNGGFGGGTPPGGRASSFEYAAATEITEAAEVAGQTYASEAADESALIVNTTDAVTITNPTVTKTGDSNGGDSCNFYGLNAALLVMGGSTTTITGGTIESSASGANGVFCYGGNGASDGAGGDGTTVIISDTTITTTGNGSGGIMTTGGGTTYASNLTVTTAGGSSAPIRTDRGGGTVVVDGGTYTSNGLGSPAIYSTADITVKNATLASNLSEGVCIEGMNSITLENCDMTASNTAMNGKATFLDTIMIYQSMSGDADSGTSSFTMTGGRLTSLSGHMFHVTNTHAVITLSGVTLSNEGSDVLLSVCDDGWSGASNTAELVADAQELSGTILVGNNSTMTVTLQNGSAFEGTFSGEITNAKGSTVSTEIGTVNVILDSSSTWTLTADTYITTFEGSMENVVTDGYTLYVNGVAVS